MAIQNSTPFVRHVGGTEGTTGWSRTDVLDAIEQVLADAGVHGSSERKAGIVVNCLAPGSTEPYNASGFSESAWRNTGGEGIHTVTHAFRNIRVTANGSSNYVLTPIWQPAQIMTNGEIYMDRLGGGWQSFSGQTTAGNTLDITSGIKRDGWQTGDSFILRNPSGDPSGIPPELTVGNTYYMIVAADYSQIQHTDYPDTLIGIADSLANAQAGTAITFASQWTQTTAYQDNDINAYKLEFEFPAITKLTVRQDDYITFHLTGLSGHPTVLVDTNDTTATFPGGTYNTSRELKYTGATIDDEGFQSLTYRAFPTGLGLETGRIVWHTRNWTQGDYALQCKNHAAMQNIIEVEPSVATYQNGYNAPYWDYEVPASGGREACTFRVYRRSRESSYIGQIEGIRVQTPDAKGWSNDEVFTIPGSATGGLSPRDDIIFGVNSSTTQQQADNNAVPSVQVMDIGSGGSNFWARYNQTNSAFVEIENDTNKTFGTTYYGIKLKNNSVYQLQIGSGVEWKYLNWNPTTTVDSYEGVWGGEEGMDVSRNSYSFAWNNSYYHEYTYGIGTQATSYPMKVQVWKANTNDPQDPNFFVLQFVQNVAGEDESTLSLYFHNGTVFGNGIWDLDHVWLGGITQFRPATYQSVEEVIEFATRMPRCYQSVKEDLNADFTMRRVAEYGFFREAEVESSSAHTHLSYFANNIYTDNSQGSEVVKLYFRDSAVDKTTTDLNWSGENIKVDIDYTGGQQGKATGGSWDYSNTIDWYFGNKADVANTNQVSSSADYYKPIKGIPLQNAWAPVPYYIPDDYVLIPFNVTPGATTFHTGDNIEVSASEIYKIIEVSYSINRKTFDGIASNSCKGIAFCARTT